MRIRLPVTIEERVLKRTRDLIFMGMMRKLELDMNSSSYMKY